jgi:hypothetical protein
LVKTLKLPIDVGYQHDYVNIVAVGRFGYTYQELGPNSISGYFASIGAGISVGHKNYFQFGLYTNRNFGLGVDQQVGGFSITVAGVKLGYENDGAPFEILGKVGNSLNDQGDRYRTADGIIGFRGWDVRLNMFTGEPSDPTEKGLPGYPKDIIEVNLTNID